MGSDKNIRKKYREKLKSMITGFDPEGSGYDYKTAKQFGIEPDETGHWASRVPGTGLILKGRKHHTWGLTESGETSKGYKITKKNGRYWSQK